MLTLNKGEPVYKKTFKEKLSDQVRNIEQVFNLPSGKLENFINEKLEENKGLPLPIQIISKTAGKNIMKHMPYHVFYDRVLEVEENKILPSANGALHSEDLSPALLFIEDRLSNRKIAKKNMFKAIEEKNALDEVKYNIQQLGFKEDANSLYGLGNTENFFLFSSKSSNAITRNASMQSQNIIWTLEASLGDNWIFTNEFNMLNFIIQNCKNAEEEFTEEIYEDLRKIIPERDLKEKFIKSCKFEVTTYIETKIDHFVKTIENNKVYKLKFDAIGKIPLIINSSKYLEEAILQDDLDAIYKDEKTQNLIKFATNAYSFDCEKAVKNYRRNSVVMSDTDSAYYKNGDFKDRIFDLVNKLNVDPEKLKEKQNLVLYSVSDVMASVVTTKILNSLNKSLWFSNNFALTWKGEYLMDKILLFKTKKMYYYSGVVREGTPVEEFTAKGSDKSSFSKYSRNYSVELVKTMFATENEEELYQKVFALFSKKKTEIYELFKEGDMSIYSSLKWGGEHRYENPYSQYQFVAGWVNNLLFEHSFEVNERGAYLKLIAPTLSSRMSEEEKIEEIIKFIASKSETLAKRVEDNLNKDTNFKEWVLKNGGVKSISIPNSAERIPEELLPLVDFNYTMTNNIFNRVARILEILKIDVKEISKGGFVLSCLKF